jgi:hypothetical protein
MPPVLLCPKRVAGDRAIPPEPPPPPRRVAGDKAMPLERLPPERAAEDRATLTCPKVPQHPGRVAEDRGKPACPALADPSFP